MEKRAPWMVFLGASLVPLIVSRLVPWSPAWLVVFSGALVAGVIAAIFRKLPGRIAIVIFAFVAGLVTFIATFGTVALDNPTNQTAVFDVGGRSFELDAGGHDEVSLPFGDRQFVVKQGGKVVDQFSGRVRARRGHLATPFGVSCYGIFETIYGALSDADSHGNETLKGQRFYTFDHVGYYFKSPPASVSTSGCNSGKAERHLGRAYCEPGSDVGGTDDAEE